MFRSLCASLSRFVRDQDIFYVPVSLTYEGKDAFRTRLGGLVTIFLGVIISISFVLEV